MLGGRSADSISEPDLVSWWSLAGRPGWTPDADLGTSFAWSYAGHSLGGWSRRLVEAPSLGLPWPEASDARRPVVWSDSLLARAEPLGAWLGPDAALATATSVHVPTSAMRARSAFRIDNGDFGVSRYSLIFERGDSLRWIRYQASSGTRAGMGPLGPAGDHVWDLTWQMTRGAHTVRANIGQRGAAQELAQSVVYEDVAAQSGGAEYQWSQEERQISVAFSRGLDHRLSVISDAGIPISYSRRDAQENRFEFSAATPGLGGLLSARGMLSRARVIRTYDDFFEARNTTTWGAVAYQRSTRPGTLRLELGGGNSGALDRRLVAPAASFTFGAGAARGRAFAQRLVLPVWSDLEFDQAPFLQSTTAMGLEAEAGEGVLHGRAAMMGGVTRDRALVYPYPIQDIWMRSGVVADPHRYDFALITAAARAQMHLLGLGAEGFLLTRDQDPSEPRVEPDQGARGWLEARFAAFQGDLGVRLRFEGADVGARDTKTVFEPVRLPAYLTGSALVILTIADATAIFTWRNLENVRREESWTDPQTGQLALGPGRQFRLSFTWRLMN